MTTDGGRTSLRVALVLNGGVSLAVWMSGVVRELDLICRASRGEDPPDDATAAERHHHRDWARITADKGYTLAVDIISGTSAGGINGTILATALACGAPLPDLKAVWDESASLTSEKLLWDPGTDPVVSLLDGDSLATTLDTVLGDLRAQHDPCGPPPPEVSLFVTATALGESDRTFSDVSGGSFQVADHRRLYRFRAGSGQVFDTASRTFKPDHPNDFLRGIDDLVHGTRASASYPAAFAPVEETPGLAARRYPPELATGPAGGTYLMDGGVLDNAPIEPVIDEIATRRVDGRIHRLLVYVVPSNGVVPRLRRTAAGAPPTWVQVVSSAVDMPRESDFRSDVDTLVQALGADRMRQEVADELFGGAVAGDAARATLVAGATGLRSRYRANRIDGALRETRSAIAADLGIVPVLRSDPLTALPAGLAPAWAPDAWDADAGGPAVPGVEPWPCGVSGGQRTLRVLLRACRAQIDREGAAGLAASLSTSLAKVAALGSAVHAAIRDAGGDALSFANPDLDPGELTEIVNGVFDALDVRGIVGQEIAAAVAGYARYAGVDPARVAEALVGVEIVTGALSAHSEDQGPPPFEFVRLGPDIDCARFPAAAGMGGEKLYGTRLGHFGAFGLAQWRDWDYTWGRLDAAAHIARLLRATPAETMALQEQVVRSEGHQPAAFDAGIDRLGADDQEILRRLRETPVGRSAVAGTLDSALRFLAQPGTPVTTAGRFLRFAAGRSAPSGSANPLMWAVRILASRLRRRMWHWVDRAPG